MIGAETTAVVVGHGIDVLRRLVGRLAGKERTALAWAFRAALEDVNPPRRHPPVVEWAKQKGKEAGKLVGVNTGPYGAVAKRLVERFDPQVSAVGRGARRLELLEDRLRRAADQIDAVSKSGRDLDEALAERIADDIDGEIAASTDALMDVPPDAARVLADSVRAAVKLSGDAQRRQLAEVSDAIRSRSHGLAVSYAKLADPASVPHWSELIIDWLLDMVPPVLDRDGDWRTVIGNRRPREWAADVARRLDWRLRQAPELDRVVAALDGSRASLMAEAWMTSLVSVKRASWVGVAIAATATQYNWDVLAFLPPGWGH